MSESDTPPPWKSTLHTPIPGTPEANDLVVRGTDGDPLPHPNAVHMIEKESYERVIEGLKMAADACVHLAKKEPEYNVEWRSIGKRLDEMRRRSTELAGLDLVMKQQETQSQFSGEAYGWDMARRRFLDGLRQASGGMRQLAVCFRGDFRWSLMAQELDRGNSFFRALLRGKPKEALPKGKLILPNGYAAR